MISKRIASFLTGAIALTAAVICVWLMVYSFRRGLSDADESLNVYLLMHPMTAMPFMVHFLAGHVFAWLGFNLVEVRWTTLALLILANVVLVLATCKACVAKGYGEGPGLAGWSFALLGMFFFYTATWPTLNYTAMSVVACNLFAAAMFAHRAATGRGGRLADMAMGAALALAFTARPPLAPALVCFRLLDAWLDGDETAGQLVRSLTLTVLAATALMAALVASGYDLAGQLALGMTIAKTSHSAADLAHFDLPYGLGILIAAPAATFAYRWIERRFSLASGRGFGTILVLAVAAGSGAAILQMVLDGYFAAAVAGPIANPTLKSWGPAILAGMLCMLIVRHRAVSTQPSEADDGGDAKQGRFVIRFAILLCILSFLPVVGSNSGIWHHSILNMAPLFFAVALVLRDAGRRGHSLPWHTPALALLIAVPMVLEVYANLVTRPAGLHGSSADQTVRLRFPAFLDGLQVDPQTAGLQQSLAKRLQQVAFDPARDTLLPPIGRIIEVNLVGGTGLGGGWYFTGYDDAAIWNCTVMRRGLAHSPRRVLALNGATDQPAIKPCLARLGLKPVALAPGIISLEPVRNRPATDLHG